MQFKSDLTDGAVYTHECTVTRATQQPLPRIPQIFILKNYKSLK